MTFVNLSNCKPEMNSDFSSLNILAKNLLLSSYSCIRPPYFSFNGECHTVQDKIRLESADKERFASMFQSSMKYSLDSHYPCVFNIMELIRDLPSPKMGMNTFEKTNNNPIQEYHKVSDITETSGNGCSTPKSSMDFSKVKILLKGNAYKARNVYKFIIRQLHVFCEKNNKEMIKILEEQGFLPEEITEGLKKVRYYFDLEKNTKLKTNFQALLKDIASAGNPLSYILRETLDSLISDLTLKKIGKISKDNLEIYREVCNCYYEELSRVIGKRKKISEQVKS